MEDLKAAVLKIWAHELTQEYFNKWIDSLPEHIEAVYKCNGNITKW